MLEILLALGQTPFSITSHLAYGRGVLPGKDVRNRRFSARIKDVLNALFALIYDVVGRGLWDFEFTLAGDCR